MSGFSSDILAWVIIGTFVAGAIANGWDHGPGRWVMTVAWTLFALFWFQLIPHFTFVRENYIEELLTIAAIPASFYAGWLLYNGRDTLFVFLYVVVAMGVVYLPFEMTPAFTLLGATASMPRGVLMGIIVA